MQNFTDWHKSSYSGGAGETCVEQGFDVTAERVGVRDTKRGDESPVLAFPAAAWAAFVGEVTASR
ncbi:DUF397 domain-containing protein [Streptomyces albidoflavus]|uniref:DUF397 domain-containing protein n=1 Tax=Streptomyces albidoflavus TaxID=1886 RepID=UPI0034025509